MSEPHHNPIAERFARGSFWSMLGTFAAQALALLTAVLLARIMGVKTFGAYALLNSTIATLVVFGNLGLGLTATKYMAEYRHNSDRALSILTFLLRISAVASVGLALTAAIAAPWFAARAIQAPHLHQELYLCCLVVLFSIHQTTQQGLLLGLEAFRTAAMINLARSAASLVAVLSGSVLYGISGAIAGLAGTSAMACILSHQAIRIRKRIFSSTANFQRSESNAAVLLRFSLPSVLGAAAISLGMWCAQTILARQPSGFSEVGIFNAASQFRNVVVCLPQILCSTALPILCGEHARSSPGFSSILDLLQRAVSLVTVPVVSILLLTGNLTNQVFGHEFKDPVTTVLVLLGSGLAAISTPNGAALAATGRMWLGFGLNLAWCAVLLGVSWGFTPQYGSAALATGFAATYVVHVFLCQWYTRHLMHRRTIVVNALAAACMTGVAASALFLSSVQRTTLCIILTAVTVTHALAHKEVAARLTGLLRSWRNSPTAGRNSFPPTAS